MENHVEIVVKPTRHLEIGTEILIAPFIFFEDRNQKYEKAIIPTNNGPAKRLKICGGDPDPVAPPD
jgi:hypothetical protein